MIIGGVLLLYFFSSMNVYKSLYRKVNEEKNLLEEKNSELQQLIDRYAKQVKGSISALESNQENLEVARADLQQLRIENSELKHKNEILVARAEELYAQVTTMV